MRHLHKTIMDRIHGWVHLHHAATFLLAGVGVLLATAIIVTVVLYHNPKQVVAPISVTPKPSTAPKPTIY